MQEKLFGTDGIRGIANQHPMTAEMAIKVGRAAAYLFTQKHNRGHKILIGKDTRLSGYMLEGALMAGICSMGMDVLLVGPMPTPGVAFITRSLRADAGIVISASHNPYQDNGIKFFSSEGFKLPDQMEEKIEEIIFTGQVEHIRPTNQDVGKAFRVDDAHGRYIEFVKNSLPKGMKFDGFKIVVDCAHGASYKVAPQVFSELDAAVIPINCEPDGTNINKNCGALYPQGLQEVVLREEAHLGLALDGDGDRAILTDEKGQVVDGDGIMAICALDMLKKGRLAKNTLVTTVMSNMGLDEAVEEAGGKVVRTRIGDRYVSEELLKGQYNLGGESSGHIIFFDHTTTGDGLITALQVLSILKERGEPLSALARVMRPFPQSLINVPIKEKKPLDELPKVSDLINEVKRRLGDRGRVLVRFSGTEPVARILVESRDEKETNLYAHWVAEALREELG